MEIREFIVGARQQREWGWPIILDFFVAGTGAGSFFIALILGSLPGMVLGGSLVLLGGCFCCATSSFREASTSHQSDDEGFSVGVLIRQNRKRLCYWRGGHGAHW